MKTHTLTVSALSAWLLAMSFGCGPSAPQHVAATPAGTPMPSAAGLTCATWRPPQLWRRVAQPDGSFTEEPQPLREVDVIGLALEAGCYRSARDRARSALSGPHALSPAERAMLQLLVTRSTLAMLESKLLRVGHYVPASAQSPLGQALRLQDVPSESLAFMQAAQRVTTQEPDALGLDVQDGFAVLMGYRFYACDMPESIVPPSVLAANRRDLEQLIASFPLDETRGLVAAHYLAQATCRPQDTAESARALSQEFARLGVDDLAYIFHVRAVEAAVFTSARMDDLELPNMLNGSGSAHVARDAALAAGAEAARASEALGTLQATLRDAPDDALRADTRLVQATIALRFGHDAAGGLGLARDAHRLAVRAARLDLRDAATAVTVFALGTQGDFAEAHRELHGLTASLEDRGALGFAAHLADLLLNQSRLRQAAGEPDLARAWLSLTSPLYPFLPLNHELTLRYDLASLVGMAHQREEALDLLAEQRRVLRARRAELSSAEFERTLRNITRMETLLGFMLGRVAPEALDTESFDPTGELPRALRQGDLPTIRRALNSDRLFPAQIGGMMTAGFCHALRDRADRLPETAAEMARGRDAGRRTLDQLAQRADVSVAERAATHSAMLDAVGQADSHIGVMAQQLSACALLTGDAALLRQARAVYALVPEAPVHALSLAIAEQAVAGDFVGLAQRLELIASDAVDVAGLAEGSAVSAFESAASYLEVAAAARLRAAHPDVEAVMRDLELGRARALRASRATRGRSGGVTGPVADAEAALARAQGRMRRLAQLVDEASDEARAPLTRELDRSVTEVRQLDDVRARAMRVLQQQNPGAYRAAALADPPSIDSVRQRLGPDETLVYLKVDLEYAWAILIDAGQTRVVPLEARDASGLPRLTLLLARMRHLLDRQAGLVRGLVLAAADAATRQDDGAQTRTELDAVRTELHRLLVQPLLPHLPEGRRLIVVPDAATGSIPLGAIGVGPAMWARRNPMRYLPGAHQLSAPEATRQPLTPAFVLGDPDLGTRAGAESRGGARHVLASAVPWRQLPGARAEAETVARLLGTQAVLGPAASEARARQGLSEARLVHLATHGLANPTRPDFSALVFSLPEGDAADDGILHAYEVEHLRLTAELVVLSACETGRGQIRGAEGVMAIDRAFLVAGAEAVVSTFWPVADDATSLFMRTFYMALRAGQAADIALAQATVALADDPRFQDPYYWAPFRVVGSGLR